MAHDSSSSAQTSPTGSAATSTTEHGVTSWHLGATRTHGISSCWVCGSESTPAWSLPLRQGPLRLCEDCYRDPVVSWSLVVQLLRMRQILRRPLSPNSETDTKEP